MGFLRMIIGILFFLGIAYFFSSERKKIDWRLVAVGIGLQLFLGLILIGGAQYDGDSEIIDQLLNFIPSIFSVVSEKFVTLLGYTEQGTTFLFGNLLNNNGSIGFIFAIKVLPTVIFFSTVTAGLYYLGVLQVIVKSIAWIMAKTMGLSGAESLSAAGNIFLGQTEAPLLVKPFVPGMTQSELMCLMTGGMATIAGGVLAGYVFLLGGDSPEEQVKFASYLLNASIMNAPAAIVMSKIFIPELFKENINIIIYG